MRRRIGHFRNTTHTLIDYCHCRRAWAVTLRMYTSILHFLPFIEIEVEWLEKPWFWDMKYLRVNLYTRLKIFLNFVKHEWRWWHRDRPLFLKHFMHIPSFLQVMFVDDYFLHYFFILWGALRWRKISFHFTSHHISAVRKLLESDVVMALNDHACLCGNVKHFWAGVKAREN